MGDEQLPETPMLDVFRINDGSVVPPKNGRSSSVTSRTAQKNYRQLGTEYLSVHEQFSSLLNVVKTEAETLKLQNQQLQNDLEQRQAETGRLTKEVTHLKLMNSHCHEFVQKSGDTVSEYMTVLGKYLRSSGTVARVDKNELEKKERELQIRENKVNEMIEKARAAKADADKAAFDQEQAAFQTNMSVMKARIEKEKVEKDLSKVKKSLSKAEETLKEQKSKTKDTKAMVKTYSKPIDELQKDGVRRRSTEALAALESCLGIPRTDNVRMKKAVDTVVDSLIRNEPTSALAQINPLQSLQITVGAGLSMNAVQNLQRAFDREKVPSPLSTTNSIRDLKKALGIGSEISHEYVTAGDNEITVTTFKSVQFVVNRIAKELFAAGQLVTENGKVRLMLAGDKGGGTTKVGVAFVDRSQSQSETNFQILAVYDGGDDAGTMRKCLSKLAKSVNKLRSVQFEQEGQPYELPIELFLCGDYMFLSAALGHKGPCAKEFCVYCYAKNNERSTVNRRQVPKLTFRKTAAGEYVVNDSCIIKKRKIRVARRYSERTFASYMEDALHDRNSVAFKPLFRIKMGNVVPPVLHCFMGAFLNLMEYAERLAVNEHLGEEDKLQFKDLSSELSHLLKDKKSRADQLKAAEEEKRIIKVAYLAAGRLNARLQSSWDAACGANCLLDIETSVEISKTHHAKYSCDQCKKLKHAICDLIITEEDFSYIAQQQKSKKNKPICKECDMMVWNATNMMQILNKKLKESCEYIRSLTQGDQGTVYLTKRERTLSKALEEKGGETYRKLQAALKSVGCDPKAYFQKFCGNHIRKALTGNNPQIICAVFDKTVTPNAVHIEQAFNSLGKMQNASKAQNLTVDQIEEYRRHRNTYFAALLKLDPSNKQTAKNHILDCHVIPFLKRHLTWGKFGEQAIESKHAAWNKKERIHANCQRNKLEQRTRILNDMWIESLFFHNANLGWQNALKTYRMNKSQNKKINCGETVEEVSEEEEEELYLDVERCSEDEDGDLSDDVPLSSEYETDAEA